jgi:hypothetical protein
MMMRLRSSSPTREPAREARLGEPAVGSLVPVSRGGREEALEGGEGGVPPGERAETSRLAEVERGGVEERRRRRGARAAMAGTAGAGVLFLARLVMLGAVLVALLIAVAIVLRDVDANSGNSVVHGIHEGASFFAGGFTGLLAFSGHPKRAISVDWGIAAAVYLVGGLIVSLTIARIGWRGVRFDRARRPVA